MDLNCVNYPLHSTFKSFIVHSGFKYQSSFKCFVLAIKNSLLLPFWQHLLPHCNLGAFSHYVSPWVLSPCVTIFFISWLVGSVHVVNIFHVVMCNLAVLFPEKGCRKDWTGLPTPSKGSRLLSVTSGAEVEWLLITAVGSVSIDYGYWYGWQNWF